MLATLGLFIYVHSNEALAFHIVLVNSYLSKTIFNQVQKCVGSFRVRALVQYK